jgi:hypothetical protein
MQEAKTADRVGWPHSEQANSAGEDLVQRLLSVKPLYVKQAEAD